MAFDPVRGETVLFGGNDNGTFYGDTWVWNGSNWILRTPIHSPPSFYHVMAFDAPHSRVLLFGGRTGGTPTWDGTDWNLLSPSGNPPGLGLASMTFDSARGQLVLMANGAMPKLTLVKHPGAESRGNDSLRPTANMQSPGNIPCAFREAGREAEACPPWRGSLQVTTGLSS